MKSQINNSKASEEENMYLMAELRKENIRLQKLNAKQQVAHESEMNKLRAEHAEEMAQRNSYSIEFVDPENKVSK